MRTTRELVVPAGGEELEAAPCAECDAELPHRVVCTLRELDVPETPEEGQASLEVESGHAWALLACHRCGRVILRESAWSYGKDEVPWNTDAPSYDMQWHPEAAQFIKANRRVLDVPPHRVGLRAVKSASALPIAISELYQESLLAARFGHAILALLGLRTIIQRVCRDCGAKDEPLAKQIDMLRERGFLSVQQASFLHGVRLMGNEAAHDVVESVPHEKLRMCFEIVNHVLAGMYILPQESAEFDARRDPTAPK